MSKQIRAGKSFLKLLDQIQKQEDLKSTPRATDEIAKNFKKMEIELQQTKKQKKKRRDPFFDLFTSV